MAEPLWRGVMVVALSGCANLADPRPQYGPTLAMLELSTIASSEISTISIPSHMDLGAIIRTLDLPGMPAPYRPRVPEAAFDDSMVIHSSLFTPSTVEITFFRSSSGNMRHATVDFGQSRFGDHQWLISDIPFRHFDTPTDTIIFTPIRVASRCNCLTQDVVTPYLGNGLLELNYPENQGRIANLHMTSKAGHQLSGSLAFRIDNHRNGFIDGDALLYLSVDGGAAAPWHMSIAGVAQQVDPPRITGHIVGTSKVGGMWMIGHFTAVDQMPAP